MLFPHIEGSLKVHSTRLRVFHFWQSKWFSSDTHKPQYLGYMKRRPCAAAGDSRARLLEGELDMQRLQEVTVKRVEGDSQARALFSLTFEAVSEPVRVLAQGQSSIEQWRCYFSACLAAVRGSPMERATVRVVALTTA